MPPLRALRENFSLMVVEVGKQVEETRFALMDWDGSLGESILNRDDLHRPHEGFHHPQRVSQAGGIA